LQFSGDSSSIATELMLETAPLLVKSHFREHPVGNTPSPSWHVTLRLCSAFVGFVDRTVVTLVVVVVEHVPVKYDSQRGIEVAVPSTPAYEPPT